MINGTTAAKRGTVAIAVVIAATAWAGLMIAEERRLPIVLMTAAVLSLGWILLKGFNIRHLMFLILACLLLAPPIALSSSLPLLSCS